MSSIVKGIVGVAEIVVGTITAQLWLVGLGVSTLIATAASLLSPSKKNQGGLQAQIAYDPTFARQLIVGRTLTAGSLVAQFTHDSLPGGGGNEGKNRVLEIVIALADHECDALETIIVNGQVVDVGTFDATLGYPITTSIDPDTGLTSLDYTGKMWVGFHSGADSQPVDSHLHTVLGTKWPTTSVGTNVCYARVTCVYDTTLFAGIPQLQFVLRGAKLYDPRLDTTVGGSGSQRWGTPSTYVWTDNLAVISYNLIRGIYVGGNLFFGASATAEEAPFDPNVAAMNVCDESVSLKAGGTEKRYAGGGQVAVSQGAQGFLASLATAMGGYIGTGGGSIVILPGAAQTPVVSFTDDDIMAREPYENAPKFGFDSLKNAVYATYVDPTQNWTRNSLPERASSTDATADGGIALGDSYSFDQIYSNTQAQRVMEIIRRRNRRQISQTVTLRPSAVVVERGDWVQWTSSQWSYSTKSFISIGVQVLPNLDTVLSLVEVDSTIFDWVPSTDELPPAGGRLGSANPPVDAVPAGVTAAPLTLTGDTGRTAPSFQVTFTDPVDPTITGFQVEYRLHGTTDSQFGFTNNVADGLLTLPHLVPNSTYDYRYQFVGVSGRVTPWSSWSTFITDNVSVDIGPGTITADMFAAGIDPVYAYSGAPPSTSGTFVGQVAVSTTDKQLYRWNGTAWILDVPVVNITGFGDTSNMLLNTNFNSSYWTFLRAAYDSTSATLVLLNAPGVSLSDVGNGTTTQSQSRTDNTLVNIQAGKNYFASVDILSFSGFTGVNNLLINWFDSAGGFLSSSNVASSTDFRTVPAASNTIDHLAGNATAPSNAVFSSITVFLTWSTTHNNASKAAAGSPRLNLMISTPLVVAGAITATQIAANTITAGQIAANTITATQIASGTITATQIAANSLTSGTIAANAITAGAIAAGAINASNIIVNNIIVTGHITANAVTQTATLDGPYNTIGTSEGGVFSSFPNYLVAQQVPVGGKVLILFTGSFTRTGGHSPTVTLRLRTGTSTSGTLINTSFSGGSGVALNQPFTISYVFTSASLADYTFFLSAESDDANCTINDGVMIVQNLKNG